MATVTRRIGPADHGQRLTLDEFCDAEFEEGPFYELGRGAIVVIDVPGIHHGRSVDKLARLFILYDEAHPGVINYRAGGGECRLRVPGMQCDRHPDQSVYLLPPPEGPSPWTRWIPEIVVEVLSEGSEERDLVEKREEYLRAGVTEYWILDPFRRRLLVLQRLGDIWQELVVPDNGVYRPHLLPGLEVRPGDLLGPVDSE